MSNAGHPIKAVARLTGLSAYVIRIWEHRYGAVKPERTGTNRRLYSLPQIERLTLLREMSQAGHNIGLIARLPTERLRELAAEAGSLRPHENLRPRPAGTAVAQSDISLIEECVAAVEALDATALEAAFKRGVRALGTVGLLQRVVGPLAQRIGEMWINGTITAAHEHLASAVMRNFLWNSAKPYGEPKNGPVLVVATPAGQLHELGALLVAALATNLGWRVTYLGASLPAAEIAGAALQSGARAVALSLVYPADDPGLAGELIRLRELLPDETDLVAGGRAAPAYRETLESIGAFLIGDLSEAAPKLEALRRPASRPAKNSGFKISASVSDGISGSI
jgi:DNA-binding transcriptional MerR regulator/methylmalonyl-CoA mutase cobalamin-binding subunit